MVSSSEEQKYVERIEAALAATNDVARDLASRKVEAERRQERIKQAERQIAMFCAKNCYNRARDGSARRMPMIMQD